MPRLSPKRRHQIERESRLAETYASICLQFKGYRIIARRHKTHLGEIDILALKRRHLISVEVKKRKSHDLAMQAVSKTSQRRIVAATELYIAQNRWAQSCAIRFDLVTIDKHWRIRHVKDAWRDDSP